MKDRTKRRKFNRTYKAHFKLGRFGFIFLILSLVLVCGLLYLSQTNKLAVRGYDIASLQQQINTLTTEKNQLDMDASNLQSMQQIEQGLKNSGMVPVKTIDYVENSSTIALNR
jgi:cell division protein FtsL